MDSNNEDSTWCMYVITSAKRNRTYVGVTNNMVRRLRQHNEEIKGGAKSTRGLGPWNLVLRVTHLNKKLAYQMEWAMHRLGRTCRPRGMTPVERRLYHLFDVVLQRDRVTKNAMLTSESGYQVELVNGHEINGVKKTLHPPFAK